mmetsp:Transcript_19161/g.27959  ORF Transcript_19161/g.27959 Transcript_19161/m.27959 type:complete len:201 (+) Transcript_19161:167-769(+)
MFPKLLGSLRLSLPLEEGIYLGPIQESILVGVNHFEIIGRSGGSIGDFHNLDVEVQCGTAGDVSSSSVVTVSHCGGDDEGGLGPDAESEDTLVPSLDDLSVSNLELEFRVSISGGIKLGSLLSSLGGLIDGSGVVHFQEIARLYLGGIVTFSGTLVLVYYQFSGEGGGGKSCSGEKGGATHGSVISALSILYLISRFMWW